MSTLSLSCKRVMTMLSRRPLFILALAAGGGVAVFLLYAVAVGAPAGFPLDDAWIHQTYARNLVQHGDLVYYPGLRSVGSTSPLYTLLLSVAYAIGLPYRVWTVFLGWLALTGIGWGSWRLAMRLFPGRPRLALAAGLLCCSEWHMVWAALSGMETALFCALGLILFGDGITLADFLSAGRRERLFDAFMKPLRLGLLAGLLVLTRPEGLLLFGLVGLNLWVAGAQSARRKADGQRVSLLIKRLALASAGLTVGCLLLLIPYGAFNFATSGWLFPNTFYAKQMEYRSMIEGAPLWRRWLRLLASIFVGPQALLVPGMVWAGLLGLRDGARRWAGQSGAAHSGALPFLYALSFTLVYAIRLPVTYQHGRYLMPVIPLWIVMGLGGTLSWLGEIRASAARRLASRSVAAVLLAAAITFLFLGAGAYVGDIEFIEGEMVTVARWLDAHTPPDALIAVHDIGVIGYFTRRPLLDLAGLITPEVIPIIRDGPALLQFMQERGARYLVTFPSWYPSLAASPALEMVYQTDCPHTRAAGLDNMAVYRLR